MEQALNLRAAVIAALVLAVGPVSLAVVVEPPPAIVVEFPFEQMPHHFWSRELVWLHNLGVSAIEAPHATPELTALAAQAAVKVIPMEFDPIHISALSPDAILTSRQAIAGHRQMIWADVETQVAPQVRKGAVSLAGEEEPALQTLRREASIWNYWGDVLRFSGTAPLVGRIPDTLSQYEATTPEASALSVINRGKLPWHGELRAWVPSVKRDLVIPDVSVPARDALLLPIDVTFANARFCKFCSGMSNSERLFYATAELTGMEYENGILSFEFYAPAAGFAILQLERQPMGPMLAGGRLVPFDWDTENRRARLPIPAGKGAGKRTRIAITMTGPDEVASFIDTRTLIIGQTNHILTDYSSEAFARRSRLIAPDGWKCVSEVKSPTQTAYSIDVPASRLHGDHAELRLEADGVGMSHVRVQLLRALSVHVAEASALHFGASAALVSDPPLIPVESPNGRSIAVQVRNNAPEIRTFQVELSGDGVDFSPSKTEISIGASMEREISVRVFAANASAGLHTASVKITSPMSAEAQIETPLLFTIIPRGGSVTYTADLTGAGQPQTIWENARLRAVFSQPDGGRWLEFFSKESGDSFLPAEGVALNAAIKVALHDNVLTVSGATALPRGGKIGNVEWKAETIGPMTSYRVTDATGKQ